MRFARATWSVMTDMQSQAHWVDETGRQWPKRPAHETGVRGRCPRCGEGHIFNGFLTMRDHCEVCGLNYSFADPADGPAVFVQLFACVPGVIFIIMLEIMARPGVWVHLAVGVPVLIAYAADQGLAGCRAVYDEGAGSGHGGPVGETT